jgi:hypothetical protein
VLGALESNGIVNETVVFFSGDNGPAPGQHGIMYFNSQGSCGPRTRGVTEAPLSILLSRVKVSALVAEVARARK